MGLTLGRALRLLSRDGSRQPETTRLAQAVAFVGAGGKTASILALAHELPGPTLITTTTHIGDWQIPEAATHVTSLDVRALAQLRSTRLGVITGPPSGDGRLGPPSAEVMEELRRMSLLHGWPLLIEADGARMRPLKAPGGDEPQIPAFTEVVVVIAGLEAVGQPLGSESVHRHDIFSGLTGLPIGSPVSEQAVGRYLRSPNGGLKGIPARSRRIALLNQAEGQQRQAAGKTISAALGADYDAIIVASARSNVVQAVFEPAAGIVLAAGGASRYGSPKQLLTHKGEPLVRRSARTALDAGLDPVIIVTGAYAELVAEAVTGLDVVIARNDNWRDGQASSVQAGLSACPASSGAAVFLLADQPYVTPEIITALAEAHDSEPAAIVAPLINGDRRGNPVLFDRETFSELRQLKGDAGGRAIFSKFRIHFIPWHDERLARDVDTVADYRQLLEDEQP